MLLERTLMTLQSRAETPERARELGRLGFLQWMMFLRSDANYPHEANRALAMAAPFVTPDPAVAVFTGLVRQSLDGRAHPMAVPLPRPRRRGGARARRELL